MTRHHAVKEKPLFNTTRGLLIILGIAAVIAVVIFWFLIRDDGTVLNHVVQHVHPNTGKIIAKAPKVKAAAHNVVTVAQLHAHHIRHVLHVQREHVLHLKHLAHLLYEKYST